MFSFLKPLKLEVVHTQLIANESHKDSKVYLDRQQEIDYLLILSKILIEAPYNTEKEKKIKNEAEEQILKKLQDLK